MVDIDSIKNMSLETFNRLTESQAKEMVNALRGEVNKITKQMRAEDVKSPAYIALKESGGKAYTHLRSTSGMNRNQALSELKRGMDFLNSKTGSVAGARQHKAQVLEDLGLPADTTSKRAGDVYDTYNKLKEEFPAVLNESTGITNYNSIKRRIGQLINRGESLDSIRQEIQMIYEEQQQQAAAAAAEIENGLSRTYM